MKKYFNVFSVISLALIIAVLVGDVFYILGGQLWVKSLTSACFLGIGIVSLIYCIKHKANNLNFAITMVVGLTLAMLGDILLEVDFIVGAIFFALGHVGYFIAYCMLCKFKWVDLIAGGVISLASILVILLVPVFTLAPIMKVLVICYAVVISFMLGKAVTNLIRQRNLVNLIILIGSFLFFFSDLMLLLCNFTSFAAGIRATFGVLCLATYYPAEILLALSPVFTMRKN
ncbi:MAG: lysoplasmalogenase [Clostridia bacterium]|nr:lysoplasmalogenase [Clostridia bacterium]